MDNQAQIRKGSTAMYTSTRNFPNRLGIDTFVYLGSAELASICALMGEIPSVAEYLYQVKVVNDKGRRQGRRHGDGRSRSRLLKPGNSASRGAVLVSAAC